MKRLIPAFAATLLAGCQSMSTEPLRATAALQPTKGSKAFGEATFEQEGDNKVRVFVFAQGLKPGQAHGFHIHCLLYTSDAADERSSVDLGGRRIIKKK